MDRDRSLERAITVSLARTAQEDTKQTNWHVVYAHLRVGFIPKYEVTMAKVLGFSLQDTVETVMGILRVLHEIGQEGHPPEDVDSLIEKYIPEFELPQEHAGSFSHSKRIEAMRHLVLACQGSGSHVATARSKHLETLVGTLRIIDTEKVAAVDWKEVYRLCPAAVSIDYVDDRNEVTFDEAVEDLVRNANSPRNAKILEKMGQDDRLRDYLRQIRSKIRGTVSSNY